jgi:CRISPR-associated exonuclease Cas4
MLDDTDALTVTDLKQYAFCPRVVFYERCLPHLRPRTYKMDAGKARHEDEADRASRRAITRYNIVEGERRFNVRLFSERLGLWGLLDEVALTSNGTAIPVDYKLATSVSPNHRIQLTAYALMLEDCEKRRVEQGFVYLVSPHKLVAVPITAKLRSTTLAMLDEIKSMIAAERMPLPVTRKGQCVACEFRRFCNDV